MSMCASYLTLSGAVVRTDGRHMMQVPAHGPMARSRAACAAGFDGMGMALADLDAGHNLARFDVPVRELEWFDLSMPDWPGLASLLHVADRLGTVERIHTGSAFPRTGHESGTLAKLARMARCHGIRVAVEPVAFGGLPMVNDVLGVIEDAGARRYGMRQPPCGVGVLYDVWHVWRMAGALPRLRPEMITAIQISGNYCPAGDAMADAMNRAMPCSGQNGRAVRAFLAGMRDLGCAAPVAVEAPNAAYRSAHTPLAHVARMAASGAVKAMHARRAA